MQLFLLIICFNIFRQYLVIGIKDCPVEIWDLKSMSLLSKMSKRFPPAVCMVNITHQKHLIITPCIKNLSKEKSQLKL